MRESSAAPVHSELRSIVAEASLALARLDSGRLEELAFCCAALNRDLETTGPARKSELARQAEQARGDMAVFRRVLDATRANVMVIKRLRELRAGRKPGYAEAGDRVGDGHGNH